MAQLLALEWNAAEARVVVAAKHGTHAVIEQAFAIPLRPSGAEGEQAEPDIGARIAEALGARGLRRAEALVAVGRANIELRQLQVPNVPDGELPEIVRMQAMREFNELDEKWALDFVPIDEAGEGPRTVLATAIAPALLAQIEGICQQSDLKMRRLLLRSCGAASLLARSESARVGQVRLLVDLLTDEADLTVMIDGRTIFLRTTRISGDPPQSQALLAEIRLTMAAVQNQLGGRKVTAIVLCGLGDAHAALARQIEKELETSVKLFDPFAGLELGPQLRQSPPEHPGRFAPLLGVLLAEFEQTEQAIDFLHPRRQAEPPNQRKKLVLAGVLVGVLLLAYLVYARLEYGSMSGQVAQLKAQVQKLDADIAALDKATKAVPPIKKWSDGEVIWLDQLRALSKDFPTAERALLNQLSCKSLAVGGMITLKGSARTDEDIEAMKEGLHAHEREVQDHGNSQDPASRQYPWQFDTSVIVSREVKP